jgi:hypothetical protein
MCRSDDFAVELATLTQLTELTLRDEEDAPLLHELVNAPTLMQWPAPPVLPASLQVLRAEVPGTLRLAAERPAWGGLASTVIPVLELRAGTLSLSHVDPDVGLGSADWEPVQLPTGFRALWLRTHRIAFEVTGHANGEGNPVQRINFAEELYRFLSSTAGSYREFRLLVDGRGRGLTVEVEWVPHLGGARTETLICSDNLTGWAAAMVPLAPAHGLDVSVSEDQAQLRVVRVAIAR